MPAVSSVFFLALQLVVLCVVEARRLNSGSMLNSVEISGSENRANMTSYGAANATALTPWWKPQHGYLHEALQQFAERPCTGPPARFGAEAGEEVLMTAACDSTDVVTSSRPMYTYNVTLTNPNVGVTQTTIKIVFLATRTRASFGSKKRNEDPLKFRVAVHPEDPEGLNDDLLKSILGLGQGAPPLSLSLTKFEFGGTLVEQGPDAVYTVMPATFTVWTEAGDPLIFSFEGFSNFVGSNSESDASDGYGAFVSS